ncbi:hypothetical protein PQR37_10400 [Paraburkholderia nemoris]|uniref:hypothetical protein n=1 Tax=Paraburkholderia TaxID=1822464 RepID=UPI0038B70737
MNVYFDNNTLPDLVRAGVDPISALMGSEFIISVTPDLATEYQQAIDHQAVQPAEKELCQRLLTAATERGIFGFAEAGSNGGGYSGFGHGYWATDSMSKTLQSIKVTERPGKAIPKNRTDAFLAALAEGAVVITNNLNDSHFKQVRAAGHHVYSWAEIIGDDDVSDLAIRLRTLLVRPR